MTNSKRVQISLATRAARVAADEARSTSEGQETPMHLSGGVLVATADDLVSTVDASGGKVEGLEGNEGRVAEMWINMPRRYTHLRGLPLAQ